MKVTISLIVLTFLFSACDSKQKRVEKQRKHIAEMKNEAIFQLASKYNIKYKIDTLSWRQQLYSIDFKPVISSKYQILDNIVLTDVYEKDSIEYVSITSGFMPAFYFDFPITKEQESKLRTEDNEIVLVVSINDIRKVRFTLDGADDGEGTIVTNVNKFSDFIGKGEIIDIALIKKHLTE